MVVEDAPAGLAAAKAAGTRAVAVMTTHDAATLSEADLTVPVVGLLGICAEGGQLVVTLR